MRSVSLEDGARIRLRPVRPDDKARFRAAFDGLSRESRYRRFLTGGAALTEAELKYFTEVDHVDHQAIVALDAETGAGIGVARYVRLTDAPSTAEVAVTVVDRWQGRGVATALLHELLDDARRAGIHRVTATVLATNAPAIELVRGAGSPRVLSSEHGVEDLIIDIPDEGLGDLRVALRRAAARMPPMHGGDSAPRGAESRRQR